MEYAATGWLAACLATAWLAWVSFGATSTGAYFLGYLLGDRFEERDKGERILFSIGLGLAVLAFAVLGAGLAGYLTPATCYLLSVVMCLPALLSSRVRSLWKSNGTASTRFSLAARCATVLVVIVLGLSWLQATLPPIAADALSYHLSHPKAFLASGRIAHLPFSRESLWPYLMEMLFTFALPTGGVIMANLFHWLYFVLTGAALFLMASRFAERRTAALAALFFYMTPGAFAQSGQPYVDLALGFYFLMTLYSFFLYDESPSKRFAALVGLFAGAALSVKFLALGGAAVLTVMMGWRARKRPADLGVFALTAGLAGGVWYLRSWIVLGNPLYPFFPELFGGKGVISDIGLEGMGTGFRDFLLLPWRITFSPQNFGGDILGPWMLWALPGLVVLKKLRGRWVYAFLFTVCYALFIFKQSQNTRFFMVLLPWVCLFTAKTVREFEPVRGRWFRVLMWGVIGAVFAAHLGIFLYRTREAWPLLTGRQDLEAYRARRDRSYAVYAYLEKVLKEGELVFNPAEAKFFYCGRPGSFVMANTIFMQSQPGGIAEHLQNKRYAYIWIEREFNHDIEMLAQAMWYQNVFESEFTEGDRTYRYRVYKAPETALTSAV